VQFFQILQQKSLVFPDLATNRQPFGAWDKFKLAANNSVSLSTVTAALLAFPLLLLIQSILLIGLGLIIATLNVFYRDVQHLTRVTLSLLFYLVPVFYRPQQAGASFSKLLMLNPIAVLIQSYRDIFFYQHVPQWGPLLFAIAICSFIGGLGYLFYSRFQPLVFDAL